MRSTFAIAGLIASLEASQNYLKWSDDWKENSETFLAYCDEDEDSTITYKEFFPCLKKLDDTLEDEEIEREWVYSDLDDNQKLDWNEIKMVNSRRHGPQIDEDADFDATIKWLDYDENGGISWTEFKAAWQSKYKDWDYQTLREVFEFADFDRSGQISMTEAHDEHDFQGSFDRKFSIVDSNRDGKLDLPEWFANRLFLAARSSESGVRERFGYYDENADGFVDRNELYRVVRA